ncbi:hypothetical protein [Pelosinus fermentans]|uniref:Uncharacterized protein n=1 Tax=Pelosinus fermentans JBW45 TaxID=1192197 RepID=A0A0C5Q2I4_9FIRM|nr:hypothetical protein JBW_04021 [Pelosinus fermentans JBW45]
MRCQGDGVIDIGIIERLSITPSPCKIKAIIAEPEFQKNVENNGLQFEYLNPEESQAKWLYDNQTLSKIVRETGILERIKEQKK